VLRSDPPNDIGDDGKMNATSFTLTAGSQVLVGSEMLTVSPELAVAFQPGDRLVGAPGALLHIEQAAHQLVSAQVLAASGAFSALGSVSDESITRFFHLFADRLADDSSFQPISEANAEDVNRAVAAGRTTTRLVLSDRMRADMIDGLRTWAGIAGSRDVLLQRIEHDGWSVEQRKAPLGVIGFVFEGRPNVFADACGVLRTGNTVVFRIGSDALGTARAIMNHAVRPALHEAGLPVSAVGLLDSPSRATGWALFANPLVSLAVARGSGQAVAQLGAVARQAGVPVSLHGTGGAWMIAGLGADDDRFQQVVRWSLDRKVCNTLNVCVIPRVLADRLLPRFLAALEEAAATRGSQPRLHVVEGSEHGALKSWFERTHTITRAEGSIEEPAASWLPKSALGTEWEWEGSPEVSVVLVDTVEEGIALYNRYSPRLVATLVSEDGTEQDAFFQAVDCPFVGDGFTRWVDGQFALNAPELGLSNWENGRLFARSAVLSGDTVFTVRTRVRQTNPGLHR
jgi:glutamate-5-semialdehyde dehydrogenase